MSCIGLQSTMLIASASDSSVSESSEFEILEDTCAKVKVGLIVFSRDNY